MRNQKRFNVFGIFKYEPPENVKRLESLICAGQSIPNCFGSYYWVEISDSFVIVGVLVNGPGGYTILYSNEVPGIGYDSRHKWIKELEESCLSYRDSKYLYKIIKKKCEQDKSMRRANYRHDRNVRFWDKVHSEYCATMKK